MSARHLRNISISQFESFLELAGCRFIWPNGGHYIYSRCDCLRPITFQSHIDPVPEFIIKNCLKTLGYTKSQFFEILDGTMVAQKNGEKYNLIPKVN